jgi:putative endonuclease
LGFQLKLSIICDVTKKDVTKKEDLGKLGEEMACGYLVGKGYKIIERNFKKPWGELDIIVIASDKTLVFVEVKTGSDSDSFKPEDQMTLAKIRKFKRAAALYAGHRPELIEGKKGWRLDLIAIIWGDTPVVRHYEQVV